MKAFKQGQWLKQAGFRSFVPTEIHRPWSVDDMELLHSLSRADRALGRLDMFSEYVPDIDLFVQMHITKEATKSSQIEGTQTGIAEAVLEENEVQLDRRDDWAEVQNYVAAMDEALRLKASLPLSSRLLRATHATLLRGVRGRDKLPGEFRRSQNWVGGSSPVDAAFVPPPHTEVERLMGDLENFLHDDTNLLPDLLKIGIAHYQFETIHPFLDGNGRIGRLMITLYLMERDILKRPVLYLSDFFERNRRSYYDALSDVREKGDLTRWLKLFLNGVIDTASSGRDTFDAILKLQRELYAEIEKLGARAGNARRLLDQLFGRPIQNADRIATGLSVSKPTAYSLIRTFEDLGILVEFTGGQRNRLYSFDRYIKLF